MERKHGLGLAATGLAFLCAGPALADQPASIEDLRSLSIEQLANLEVTSVSRRSESVGRAAASVEVITADDIRRSGVQTLPEALRLARNLEVAQVDAQRYAISARGFNSFQASNKLLVLIDGRSVYTPLYSGVFWDQQHVPLQNIERIEVISGPGGTLWGANAVNGVINIITSSSADSQGLSIDAIGGAIDQTLDVRYGGRIGDAAFRVYASGYQRGSTFTTTGDEAGDDWNGGQIGFRSDWGAGPDAFMLQGSLYHDDIDIGGSHDGGHLLGLWTHQLGDGDSLQVQGFYSNAERETAFVGAAGTTDALEMWDISAQHNFSLDAHQIVWGGGYRSADSEFVNTASPIGFAQPRRRLRTVNLFVQDEIALRDDLALTLGLKLEDHTLTDLEYMPNVRLAWRPSDTTMIWGAVSRAVRTPSRIDFELELPGFIEPGHFVSEELLAYELGYRTQPTSNSTISATLYRHEYENLRSSSQTPPGAFPVFVGNGVEGEVYGLELWGDLALNPDWRLSAGMTLLEQEFREQPFSFDVNASGDDPAYQFFVRSRSDLSDRLTLDLNLRAIDEAAAQVPGYVELGARLGLRLNDRVELALAGHNLLDESHPEAIEGVVQEARRQIMLSARVTY